MRGPSSEVNGSLPVSWPASQREAAALFNLSLAEV